MKVLNSEVDLREGKRLGGWIVVFGETFKPATIVRFWIDVDRRGDDECWNWIGKVADTNPKAPYGRFWVDGRREYSHRYSYTIHKEPIPNGLDVLHSCDNYRCVNPKHLSVGTHRENMRQSIDRGRFFFAIGVKNGRATITPEIVRNLRKEYMPGHGPRLAKKYRVSESLLHSVVHNHTWKHVK